MKDKRASKLLRSCISTLKLTSVVFISALTRSSLFQFNIEIQFRNMLQVSLSQHGGSSLSTSEASEMRKTSRRFRNPGGRVFISATFHLKVEAILRNMSQAPWFVHFNVEMESRSSLPALGLFPFNRETIIRTISQAPLA